MPAGKRIQVEDDEPTIPLDDDEALVAAVEQLRDAPGVEENPLWPLVEGLYGKYRQQRRRLDKLVRIADGFDNLSHHRKRSLMERYDHHLRRMEKIARISDLYQQNIMELNASLRHAAQHDVLTDLPNRRHITERLKELIARADRRGAPFSLVLLDLDHFKAINDTYGHEMGDTLLCLAANTALDALRACDLCGRWGGEEFLLLLPDTTAVEAVEVSRRVIEALKAQDLDETVPLPSCAPVAAPLRLSASAGVTEYASGDSHETLVRRADDAMYRAKHGGRGRVVLL